MKSLSVESEIFIGFLSLEHDSSFIFSITLAVDEVESDIICAYDLSPLDLAPSHSEVLELRCVELGGPGGPWWSSPTLRVRRASLGAHGHGHGCLSENFLRGRSNLTRG